MSVGATGPASAAQRYILKSSNYVDQRMDRLTRMTIAKARVPTASGAKYVQQLCKHWGHKFDVELSDRRGIVRFPNAVATMEADADALLVTIEAQEKETIERMKGVVASHLDRFAFREAPLAFDWSPGG